MKEKQELYTRDEAAEILKISVTTLMRQVRARKLYAFKVGSQVRIPSSSLDDFIAGRPPAYPETPLEADDNSTNPGTPSLLGGDK